MTVTSGLNLGLPAAPLADDPALNGELQIIYNALHLLQQVLNDAGIPSGGVSPSPAIADVPHGGTGVATITGMLYGNGVANITGVASAVVGNVLKVTGANTYAFSAPGYGDVTGPAGATGNNVAVFNGATGKIIKDGGTLGTAAYAASTAFEPADATILKDADIGSTVQAYDADLTTWAGITPAAGIGTFLATPSSANLASALTDESGSGVLPFLDYNTWTPSLGGTTTYLAQTGHYVKIGTLVFIRGTLYINAIGTGSTSEISGLPFSAVDSNPLGVQIGGSAIAFSAIYAYAVGNKIYMTYNGAGATSNQGAAAVFGAGTYIDFSGCYRTT